LCALVGLIKDIIHVYNLNDMISCITKCITDNNYSINVHEVVDGKYY